MSGAEGPVGTRLITGLMLQPSSFAGLWSHLFQLVRIGRLWLLTATCLPKLLVGK